MHKYASSQSREYDQGVVEVLIEELMDTTRDFRRVLEVRHENQEKIANRWLCPDFVSSKRQWIVWMTSWMLLK